jgi:hypothetical protein
MNFLKDFSFENTRVDEKKRRALSIVYPKIKTKKL